ncbi:MAG TPA: TAT-variant-translocated molybdopterin oxidoreductase [Thermoanaerobaculia bacterium]|nr:TAT-variant-translocated molybdopterin oxidoreductase [Thermoanaerobaculia bacterium]
MTDAVSKLPIVSDPGDCHAEWKRPEAESAAPDLAAVRERLRSERGPRYWRSLEEVAGTPEFEQMLHREFPRFAAEWPSDVSRRNFLQLAAASLGLAGLTACTRQPIEKIVPYVRQPEEIVPGRPLYFATAMPLSGTALPLLVESHEGRPTKVEGNPEHPSSRGSSSAVAQASVLGLYDPDRSQTITNLGRISSWPQLFNSLAAAMGAQTGTGGAGLRLLTGPVTSPTEAAVIGRLLETYPNARWHRWDPLGADGARVGAVRAFGRPLELRRDLSRADVIVALDSDFLVSGAAAVGDARDFADRRRLTAESREMNRLYVAEATPSPTGTMADHRLAARPSELPGVLLALAAAAGLPGANAPAGLGEKAARWAEAAGRDLAAHRGRALVVAGDTLGAAAHVLVHALNDALGAVVLTLHRREPSEADQVDGLASLTSLFEDLRAGKVDVLLLSGVNPVYDAPADLGFAAALNNGRTLAFHHGLYADETAEYCAWHLPATHYLESWGDARAADGSVCLIQPLIEPLYGGRSTAEFFAAAGGRPDASGQELLRETWPALDDEAFRRALHDGFVPGSAPAPAEAVADPAAVATAVAELAAVGPTEGYELALRPDPSLLDGRFANNGWLQELPKPITKLTWDNVLLLSPRTAEELGVGNEDRVEIALGERSVTAPAWILPGQPDGAAALHLGFGRTRAGRVADGVGVSAFALQSVAARFDLAGVSLRRAGGKAALACSQGHYMIDTWLEVETREAERRHLVREGSLQEFRTDPEFVKKYDHEGLDYEASFASGYDYSEGNRWGMTIDLGSCTGCNACVVACQAENNIPVVGRDQVRRGREMHWIRVDRYFQGGLDEPEGIVWQPVLCMQCEQAPCETVCPVAATVHSDEGLNDMVYNRCVGTRYCSNNCPYKVRRFNFLLYQDWDTPQFKLQRNPNVTVRSRGVMEKCTYCVQRISRARIEAGREQRPIADGEVRTACQQACPTHAITFGDLNDPESAVAASKRNPRNYALLAELGTRPRTTYLALVRNPNPELVG